MYLDPADRNAPPGWTIDADGAVWSLGTAANHPGPSGTTVAPLLVPLGQPDDDGQLYVDLEAEGILSLTGDLDTACRTLHAFVAALAAPETGELDIVVVREPGSSLGPVHLPQMPSRSWDDVTDTVADRVHRSRQMLVDGRWANAFIARGAHPDHPGLRPVLVVAATAPPPQLIRLFGDRQSTALAVVLLGATVPGAAVLDCQPDSLTLADLDLVCAPTATEAAATAGPSNAQISDPPGDEPVLIPGSPLEAHDIRRDPSGDAPGPAIVVRVLGDINVDGGAPLTPKQTAVVAYIALHRPVTAERLEDAVWPSVTARTRRKRLANMLSECRGALGRDHLPPSSQGRYTLSPEVVTDAELFDHHIELAAGQEPAAAADTLRAALDLVTGVVFTYRRADRASYTWVDIENWQSTWDQRISWAAQQCADAYLATARADEAVNVAQRIQQMMPCDSGLTESLMRACAAVGDNTAVEAAYRAHVAAVQKVGARGRGPVRHRPA